MEICYEMQHTFGTWLAKANSVIQLSLENIMQQNQTLQTVGQIADR